MGNWWDVNLKQAAWTALADPRDWWGENVKEAGQEWDNMQGFMEFWNEQAGQAPPWSLRQAVPVLPPFEQWQFMGAADRARYIEQAKRKQKAQEDQQGEQRPSKATGTDATKAGLAGGLGAVSLATAAPEIGTYNPMSLIAPFPGQYLRNPTKTFGQEGFGGKEMGIDYGMPVGTPIIAPFSGTVTLEDHGKQDWGKRVMLEVNVTENGQLVKLGSFNVGHLSAFGVEPGQVIQAGQILGYSGGDPDDPSSGVSNGAHIEVQWQNSNGEYTDPYNMLKSIYGGQTYGDLFKSGALVQSGMAMLDPTNKSPLLTSDGRAIPQDSAQARYYRMIDSQWRQVYGVDPPLNAVLAAQAAGLSRVDQANDWVNRMPSPIAGMSNQDYADYRNVVDSASQKYFGYSVPDSVLQQLYAQGIYDPITIDEYFKGHPASAIPHGSINTINDALQKHPYGNGTAGSPDQIYAIWQASQPKPEQAPQPTAGQKPKPF